MNPAPQTKGPSRAVQLLGALFVLFLIASVAFEAGAQTRWLAQLGVAVKYLGLAVLVAWPLLKGDAGRQSFGSRIMIGMSMILLGMVLHWGVRFNFF